MNKNIDGKKLAKAILEDLSSSIASLKERNLKVPSVKVLLVEGDEPSKMYANQIVKKAVKVGMDAECIVYPCNFGTNNLVSEIEKLSSDEDVNAIMVQFPLPKGYDSDAVRAAINFEKDVDSLGSVNAGLFYRNRDVFIPCTAESMMELLKSYKKDLAGLKAVVLGRSHVVGRPVFELAVRENMTVTICHSKTVDIEHEIKSADVVFSTMGAANFVKKSMLKKGAIVIDAGINFIDDKVVGDVDYDDCVDVVSAITPVPGGVGPVTNAILIRNVYKAYDRQMKNV